MDVLVSTLNQRRSELVWIPKLCFLDHNPLVRNPCSVCPGGWCRPGCKLVELCLSHCGMLPLWDLPLIFILESRGNFLRWKAFWPLPCLCLLGKSWCIFLQTPFWEARAQTEETAPLTCMDFSFPPQLLVLSVAQWSLLSGTVTQTQESQMKMAMMMSTWWVLSSCHYFWVRGHCTNSFLSDLKPIKENTGCTWNTISKIS